MPTKKKSMPMKKTVKKTTAAKKTTPVAEKKVSEITRPVSKPLMSTSSSNTSMPTKKVATLRSTKTLIVLLAILIIATLAYFLKNEIIVATVNGKPITRFALIKNLEKQGGSQILTSMTTEMLVRDALKKANVTVSQDEINTEMKTIEDSLTSQGQKLDDLLAAQGMTRADIEDQIKLSKQLEKLLADKVNVSDEEIQQYFDTNKASFGKDAKLEDVKEKIREQLHQQKLSTAQQDWLTELKKTSKINYYKFGPSASTSL